MFLQLNADDVSLFQLKIYFSTTVKRMLVQTRSREPGKRLFFESM